jgi:hypothetical protein
VAGDDDVDVARHALEQPERGEVFSIGSAASKSSIGTRTSDSMSPATRTPALLDHQRGMAWGMRQMLEDPDSLAIPGDLPRPGG